MGRPARPGPGHGGRPGLVWGSPRTGMGVTPDRYGGHIGPVWGSPPKNVENRRKSKILNVLGMPSPVRIQPNIPNLPKMGQKTIFNNTPNIGFRVFFVIFYVFFGVDSRARKSGPKLLHYGATRPKRPHQGVES